MITYTINKDLNVRPETTRLLEENTGGKFLDIGHDKRFLDLAPGEKQTRVIIHRTKMLLHSKGDRQQNEKVLNGRKYSHIVGTYLING